MTPHRAKRDTSPKFPIFLRLAMFFRPWPLPDGQDATTPGEGEDLKPSPGTSGNEKEKP